MSRNRDVRIYIRSRGPGQRLVRPVNARLFFRGPAVYYRYAEPDEQMGKTTTTVKIRTGEPGEIKVIRHGEIRSEQTFVPNAEISGFYSFPQGRLPLKTRTRRMEVGLSEGIGTVSWEYELVMDGQPGGTWELKLDIREV